MPHTYEANNAMGNFYPNLYDPAQAAVFVNRVTDHRIGLSLHQLDEVMDGKLQPFIDGLSTHFQAEKLKEQATVLA